MGLKFTKEYKRIIEEISEGLLKLNNFYEFMEMSSEQWNKLSKNKKEEYAKTLSDDLFYALGTEPIIEVADGKLIYDKADMSIKILNGEVLVTTVKL